MQSRYSRTVNRNLTPREQQIYDLVVTEGANRCELAKMLGIADDTMNKHMHHIYEKTGAESAVQLVVWHYTKARTVEDKL